MPVPGVFVGIDRFSVTVRVECEVSAPGRELEVAGEDEPVSESAARRIRQHVDFLTRELRLPSSVTRVVTRTTMRGGWGIGSSAAAFAALTRAVLSLAGEDGQTSALTASALARHGSYSAAASMLGGITVIRTNPGGAAQRAEYVQPIEESRGLHLLIFPVDTDVSHQKQTELIHRDVVSSPYYKVWKKLATEAAATVTSSLQQSNLSAVIEAAERYTYENLAVIATGSMSLMPWTPATLERMSWIRDVRNDQGLAVGISVNTGPSVFAYGNGDDIDALEEQAVAGGVVAFRSSVGQAADEADW